MQMGIPGTITRWNMAPQVESVTLDPTTPPTVYGLPYKLVGGLALTLAAGDTAALVRGFLARAFPGAPAPSPNEALNVDTPNKDYPQPGLLAGYIIVKVYGATAAALGGKVYVRVNNADGTHPIGGVEAASSATVSSTAITGTGTGTLAFAATDSSVAGTYSLVLQTTSQTSKVTVTDPTGNRLADGIVGTAYTGPGITFTITAGGTMTAGDSYSPVVSHNTEAIPGASFNGVADVSKYAEIRFK